MRKEKKPRLFAHAYYGTVWYLFEQIDPKDIKEVFPNDWQKIGKCLEDHKKWSMIPITTKR